MALTTLYPTALVWNLGEDRVWHQTADLAAPPAVGMEVVLERQMPGVFLIRRVLVAALDLRWPVPMLAEASLSVPPPWAEVVQSRLRETGWQPADASFWSVYPGYTYAAL